jgi:hypothetical protein
VVSTYSLNSARSFATFPNLFSLEDAYSLLLASGQARTERRGKPWKTPLISNLQTSTREMRTLPVGMNDYIGQYGIRYGDLMASSVMVSIPVILVFFFLQRQFVAGITAGSVKG